MKKEKWVTNINCSNLNLSPFIGWKNKMPNLWDQPEVPHKGWQWVNTEDLEEASETCQMCGHENIRYVHYMQHQDYSDTLGVGCVCAEKMSGDYTNPKLREKKLISKMGRKQRWKSRKWNLSRNGNLYLKVEGIIIICFQFKNGNKAGKWGYKVNDAFGKNSYNDVSEAQIASFEDFWKLKDGD